GLDHVRIISASGDYWELQLADDQWLVASPVKWKANPYAVQQLLFHLRQLSWDSRFSISELESSGQTLASYNLAEPPLRIELHQGDRVLPLALGAPTEIGNRLYLMSSGKDYVYVVSRTILDPLQRDPVAFMDR